MAQQEMFSSVSLRPKTQLRYTLPFAGTCIIFLVATSVIAPLFATIPLPKIVPPSVPLKAPPRHVKIVEVVRTKNHSPKTSNPSPLPPKKFVKVFEAPRRIPTGVPKVVDTETYAPPDNLPPSGGPTGPGMPECPLCTATGSPIPVAPPPPPKVVASPKVSAAPTGPMKVSSGVQAAKLERMVRPPYPPLAKQARISGTVRFAAVIAPDGRIQELQVVFGHPLLIPAAKEAVAQWVYKPTLLNGEAVQVQTQIDVNFTLSQ